MDFIYAYCKISFKTMHICGVMLSNNIKPRLRQIKQ